MEESLENSDHLSRREAEHKGRSREDTGVHTGKTGDPENRRVISKASQMWLLSTPCHKLPQSW